jgi:hypothetical protein
MPFAFWDSITLKFYSDNNINYLNSIKMNALIISLKINRTNHHFFFLLRTLQ